jgi:hypothetical protein
VFAALLVAPDAARTTVSFVGSGAITVTAAATLVASWHRPSDIIGALLVSLAWGTAVLAVWSLVRGGMPGVAPARTHRTFATTGVVLAVAGLLAVDGEGSPRAAAVPSGRLTSRRHLTAATG